MSASKVLEIGSFVKLGTKRWRIGAVLTTDGGRYYMLLSPDGVVSLMPASLVEAAA